MFYIKRKTYAGRWVIKMLQAALIFGIVFFGLDALGQLVQFEEATVIEVQPVQQEVVVIQRDNWESQPQLDEYDYFYMAFDHQTANEYFEAVEDYTRAIEMNPYIAASWLNRGVAYEQIGNHSYQAMADFTHYLTRADMNIVTLGSEDNSVTLTEKMLHDQRLDLPLDLEQDQVVNISVVSSGADVVDPIIVLIGANGMPVAANDDVRTQDGTLISMDSYISNYTVETSGEYVLLVSHAGGGSYGEIDIRVTIDN